MHRRSILFFVAALIVGVSILAWPRWRANAAGLNPTDSHSALERPSSGQRTMQRRLDRSAPAPAIEPYVRPEFAIQMRNLLPTIRAAAHRHNRVELSHMSDREFAVVIALILYNENFGSLEDRVPPLRSFTPLYQNLQVNVNELGGGNLSIWPANLRPSVALEILQQTVPVPAPTYVISAPIEVAGHSVDVTAHISREDLYTQLTRELADPAMSVEYLAANLERGLYRAQFEGVPVTWRALAAWHNQGVVSPKDIRGNALAHEYVRRTSAYMSTAYALIDQPDCTDARCRVAMR